MTKPSYNLFTLDNGLRVAHIEDTATTMVAVSVLYDTGARDEDSRLTGLAHLMEHLMFGGSINIPDFDKAIQDAGGMNNAWTSNDFTCFYDVLPAHNAETAFWLESDRMISLLFTPESLETQRKVVIEEFYQQCLNRPYGTLMHEMRALAFKEHPYRWPVIGLEPSHIASVKIEQVKDFYFSHYSTSNAVLAVVGDIAFERVKELAVKWFAGIEPRQVAPHSAVVETPLNQPLEKTVKANVPNTMISIGYPMASYGTDEYIRADILSDVLASGRSSHFYRTLVQGTDLFNNVDASIWGSEHPGLFMVNAHLKTGVDTSEARKVLLDNIADFLEKGFGDKDLQRALNRFESSRVFENLGIVGRSQNLAMAVMHNEDPDTIVSRYRAENPRQVLETGRRILDPRKSVTVIFEPN